MGEAEASPGQDQPVSVCGLRSAFGRALHYKKREKISTEGRK